MTGHKRCTECGHRWNGSTSICPECEAWGFNYVPIWDLPVPWKRGDT